MEFRGRECNPGVGAAKGMVGPQLGTSNTSRALELLQQDGFLDLHPLMALQPDEIDSGRDFPALSVLSRPGQGVAACGEGTVSDARDLPAPYVEN